MSIDGSSGRSPSTRARGRYTGVTLGYQIGAAAAGGAAPLLATWLLDEFDGAWWPIATYLIVLAILSFCAVALAGPVVRKETALLTAREAKGAAV